MPDIAQRITTLRAGLPSDVELVAVSKFHSVEAIAEAYACGQRIFGESRVQELVDKIPQLPSDIQWHFIGHLQSNKVRQLVSTRCIALIESVDSERLLRLIDAESERAGICTDVLLQIHVAAEKTKFGFTPEEFEHFFSSGTYREFSSIRFRGVMGMATNPDAHPELSDACIQERIQADFAAIAAARLRVSAFAPDLKDFNIVSMGMSDDYALAIAAGSTHIRIGSAIFGNRS